ncbi:MAG TPA: SDR family NAD(P)-dependent oxidoreductase [Candidatus Binataceae bacterium]|jgi:NAD(P)-dependent dehydrogenase (short-subunit alcohol dehydrogenase family)|nr:SDR family NAD(P)-dependent oxidoreductase [Candidatus Binataceae bacterium]
MGKLDGKVAAVTGGGRGIGRAVSKALAAQGAAVVVNDLGVTLAGQKETVSPADDVVKEIKAAGGTAVSNHLDIATVAGGEGLINQAIKEFGKLDILVNIAGILRDRMIFNMSEQEWDDVIRVHLKGHYCTIRPASAHMRERKAGRIINFSSNSALGSPGQPNYAAAKAGILGLTYSCAVALQKYGITVNAIMPGAATRMTDSIPAGRMPGATGIAASQSAEGTPRDPANVAPIIIYLASDEAAEVTGQCFGASGYRISRYTHMKADRTIFSEGPWDIDRLFEIFKATLGQGMEPVNMFA